MALAWGTGAVYGIGWFGLVLLGSAMLIAIVRSKLDFGRGGGARVDRTAA